MLRLLDERWTGLICPLARCVLPIFYLFFIISMRTLLSLLALVGSLTASAQQLSFVHFGIGVNAGTNGLGMDASLGVTRFVQIRAGFSLLPSQDFGVDVPLYNQAQHMLSEMHLPHLFTTDAPASVAVNGRTSHILLDLYPKLSSFHVTLGAYSGAEDVISISNTESMKSVASANHIIDTYNSTAPGRAILPIGLHVGDYLFCPDDEGELKAEMHVKALRPYIGIGFGRAVPRKSRVGMSLDLGVQYWGKPTVYCNGTEAEPAFEPDGSKDFIHYAQTLPVYPVATLRISGRIF